MQYKPAAGQAWQPAPQQYFTGDVWFGEMAPAPDSEPAALNVLGVMFEPGARTNWHSHPAGQVLYFVTGAGKVQNEAGETVEAGPGDVVVAAANELHWHGATPGSFMVHLSITDGGPTQWDGPVTDEQYGS